MGFGRGRRWAAVLAVLCAACGSAGWSAPTGPGLQTVLVAAGIRQPVVSRPSEATRDPKTRVPCRSVASTHFRLLSSSPSRPVQGSGQKIVPVQLIPYAVVAGFVVALFLWATWGRCSNSYRPQSWVLAAATGEEEFDHTKNYYAVLGVTKGCPPEELKRAHRRLMLKYHPDVCPEAGEAFQLVNDAYRVLTDAELRPKYDRYRTNWCKWNGGYYDDVTGAVIEKALLTPKAKAREKALRSDRDFYAVLGVPRDAAGPAIKAAYAALLRQCHPDVSQTAEAKARFEAVTEAYAILASPLQRRKYDDATEWRRAQAPRDNWTAANGSPSAAPPRQQPWHY
eukprot:EG_transcript_16547